MIEWGHEYLRSLSGEISLEHNKRVEEGKDVNELIELVDVIIPYFINHNEEPEAVDLLMEVEQLSKLPRECTSSNYDRVCRYLLSCASYAADPEEMTKAYTTAFQIYLANKKYPEALRVAQKLGDNELVQETMNACQDKVTLQQLAFMLGRHRTPYETSVEELARIISNQNLSQHFVSLGRDLDVAEPKHPEAIFKTNLEERKAQIDSAKANLAMTYANGFINAGFGKDLLMNAGGAASGNEEWIYKNKENGQLAAAASLGLVLLWDIDEGLSQIDKYMDVESEHIQAGAFMAMGIVNSGIKNECDPVMAILQEKLETANR